MVVGAIIERAYPENRCLVEGILKAGTGLTIVVGAKMALSAKWAQRIGYSLVTTELLGRVYVGSRRRDTAKTKLLAQDAAISSQEEEVEALIAQKDRLEIDLNDAVRQRQEITQKLNEETHRAHQEGRKAAMKELDATKSKSLKIDLVNANTEKEDLVRACKETQKKNQVLKEALQAHKNLSVGMREELETLRDTCNKLEAYESLTLDLKAKVFALADRVEDADAEGCKALVCQWRGDLAAMQEINDFGGIDPAASFVRVEDTSGTV